MNSCYYINMSVCIYPQRAEHVQSCLTANSLRRQRRFSTTWPSYLRAWSDRSAFVETVPRPFNAGAPFINGKRASLVRPGASWTDWWHVTTSAWQWKCGPRAATTWPFCEFVRQQVVFFFDSLELSLVVIMWTLVSPVILTRSTRQVQQWTTSDSNIVAMILLIMFEHLVLTFVEL